MTEASYLDRCMYHMSHFDNLEGIVKAGALLSQEVLDKQGSRPRSIANREVQNLRKRIYVWNLFERKYRPLHSYVPFYFTTDTPMFRYQRSFGIQNEIIIFEVNCGYIGSIDQTVLFTDGNASNQQLSKSAGEKVYITPATVANDVCQRKYVPGGTALGTNLKRSDFFADIAFLDRVSWDVIDGFKFVEDLEEYKRVKHAEVLAPDRFPLDEMLAIYVSTQKMTEAVKKVFSRHGITENDLNLYLPIVCKPNLFM